MRTIKTILKWICYVLIIPLVYLVVSLILSWITVDGNVDSTPPDKTVFLSTNGVHLNIVLPMANIDSSLLSGIKHSETDQFLSFGWGDEEFYLNTPTWGDLTFITAFRAALLKSSTLMHVTRHRQERSDWVEIEVSDSELEKLNTYLVNGFHTDENGAKIRLENQGYSATDDFYKARGTYTLFKTCNTWVNTAFKNSGLKACLWTPFDFGLMNKYEP